jgi:hypothetical protein
MLSLGASFVGGVASSLFALMAVCHDMELKLEIKGRYCFKDHRHRAKLDGLNCGFWNVSSLSFNFGCLEN